MIEYFCWFDKDDKYRHLISGSIIDASSEEDAVKTFAKEQRIDNLDGATILVQKRNPSSKFRIDSSLNVERI